MELATISCDGCFFLQGIDPRINGNRDIPSEPAPVFPVQGSDRPDCW
jgi:hypothetical protein